MYRHLDDPAPPEVDGRLLAQVLQRAERIRARTRRRLAVATVSAAACVVGVAAVVVAVRPPAAPPTSRQTNYAFDLRSDPLPAGTPVPTTTLIDVVFTGRTVGFALADHRNQVVLASTTDGGGSWKVVNGDLPLPSTLAATAGDIQLEFTSEDVGYLWRGALAGGAGAPMWFTHDGGVKWTQAGIGPVVYDVSGIGSDVWALAGSCSPQGTGCQVVLEESSDAGEHWTEAPGPVPATLDEGTPTSPTLPIVSLARVDAERAYVYSSAPTGAATLAFTTDGGTSWSTRPSTCGGTFGAGGELALSSTDDLWLVCGGAASGGSQAKMLWRSSDGGTSWTRVARTPLPAGAPTGTPTPETLPLQGYVAPYSIGHKTLAVLSPTDAWLFPSGGAVWATGDGGTSWATVAGLQAADFGSGGAGNITFIDTAHGWVVEFGVGLWRTTDAVRWEPAGS